MNYAYDDMAWIVEEAFLFGDDFLVAPCLEPNGTVVNVYFPAASGWWMHLVR
jgi:alpha-glucosidase (family GH31 glycosyl hydrolase)